VFDHVCHHRTCFEEFVRQLETVDRRAMIVGVTAIDVKARTLPLGAQHSKAAMTPLAAA
jgi:hypothetical protein